MKCSRQPSRQKRRPLLLPNKQLKMRLPPDMLNKLLSCKLSTRKKQKRLPKRPRLKRFRGKKMKNKLQKKLKLHNRKRMLQEL